ncbi:acyl-CoA N-acyltransferase [Gautieria morchelliformis]|nr:acyl-CoA N-acyltransferase [Gautieria morchelliformis]
MRLVTSKTPIGTVRMHKPPGAAYYKLTRLAVLKEYRKHHLGAALVKRLHAFAIDDHVKSGRTGPVQVIAHSQIPAVSFYARFGYLPEGDEFDEDDAPHQKMVVRLQIDLSSKRHN